MKRVASILAQAGAPLRGVRCTLALSLLLSLLAGAAGADIKTLHDNGQVTWGTENEPEVIYLLDGEVCTEADAYDEIVLKFTSTNAPGTFTIASGVKVSARTLVVGGGGAGGTSTSTTRHSSGGTPLGKPPRFVVARSAKRDCGRPSTCEQERGRAQRNPVSGCNNIFHTRRCFCGILALIDDR